MTSDRAVIRLGLAEEQSYGYAQAVRVGDLVLVAGQTGVQSTAGPRDMTGQMRTAYQQVAGVLSRLGLTLADVIDETIFTTDLAAAASAGVRQEVYGPGYAVVSTLIGVAAIGSPYRECRTLVEIKCVAAVPAGRQ